MLLTLLFRRDIVVRPYFRLSGISGYSKKREAPHGHEGLPPYPGYSSLAVTSQESCSGSPAASERLGETFQHLIRPRLVD